MMELLNGKGDLDDNIRMLKHVGAKFIGRAYCVWGREARFAENLAQAREAAEKVLAADPEFVLEACVFEIVTPQVNEVAIPESVFAAFGLPAEKRNFRFDDMVYTDERFRRSWGRNGEVPDVSRQETQLWFYYQAVSYIDVGCDSIHFGQVEIMNRADADNAHWERLLTLVRDYAATHATITWCCATRGCPLRRAEARGPTAVGFPLLPVARQGSAGGTAGRGARGRPFRRHLWTESRWRDLQRLAVRSSALFRGI